MGQLVSPGVSVSIIDESAYASAGNGTVPVIVLATRSSKYSPDGTTATYTTAPFALKPLVITSQRELVQLYGEPSFTIVDGTPIHGHELNEYGLLAAYYYLGIANRVVIVRADLDMGQMEPTATAPRGIPVDGQYWINSATSSHGIFVADANGDWVKKELVVLEIENSEVQNDSAGVNGDFGIGLTISNTARTLWKKVAGVWEEVTVGVTVAPHYDIPTGANAAAGAIWFNTTSFAGGLDLQVYRYSSATQSWVLQQVGPTSPSQLVAFESSTGDIDATALFGDQLVTGSLYIQYDINPLAYRIMRWIGDSWVMQAIPAATLTPPGPMVNGTLWYDAGTNIDVYVKATVNNTPVWKPVVSALANTTSPASPSNGDVWVDTNDMANYPMLKVWDGSAWVTKDNSDQTTPNGCLFADLTATAGDTTGAEGGATSMDLDVPNPAFFPNGMLFWNSAVSSGNIKKWNAALGVWQTESGNIDSGSLAGAPYMFDKAQRRVVVKRLQAALTSNDALRAETLQFNIIATPGYVECIDEMVTLNVDRKETAFVIADTPMKSSTRMADMVSWSLGTNAGTNGAAGLVTRSPGAAIYFPSGLSTDLDGNDVAVPASHAVLRAIAYNDQVSYPWFAPAGLTRGSLSGISNLGVVNAENEFVPLALNQGQRDVLYTNNINPLVNFPGQGLYVWGQKTLSPLASALDRVNVGRLLAYLRGQFDIIARPFIFEPNDQNTRNRILAVYNGFLADMFTKRAVYDFLVVCDSGNNTPSRIDRNELYIDIAIEPVKAAEFIYIPVRVVNTGAIANGTK